MASATMRNAPVLPEAYFYSIGISAAREQALRRVAGSIEANESALTVSSP